MSYRFRDQLLLKDGVFIKAIVIKIEKHYTFRYASIPVTRIEYHVKGKIVHKKIKNIALTPGDSILIEVSEKYPKILKLK